MYCLKKSLLFIFGLIFACMYASNVEKDLDNIAITQGYGYKTANLTLLSDLCKNLKNDTYAFDVPQFFGISSKDIQTFVKNILKKDLAQEWDDLINTYSLKDNDWLTKAITSKKFPDGFLAGAKAIEVSINKSFDDVIKNNKQDLKDLFQDIKEISIPENLKTEKLMVRSTGKEDTDKLANAGGNESVANVDPETNQILMAMKIVIASYFSEKSLTQRLGAGDQSIPEAPFTPVLIQRMIGEKDETNLPRCGVMFTEETEGALSKIIKGKTSGITIIQCAFGHNEGVVNSIVSVDTYIVDSDEQQHAVIRPKQFRIAPIEALKLDRKDNDPAYINRPVLEPHAITAMKQLATELETFYKKPMDVEFVIFKEENKETIYIVQARPIVHNPDQPAPSYLNFNNEIVRNMTSVHSAAIGLGGGELKFITSNNQIVIKKTIGAALSEYQERDNKNEIKAILIEENAPVTSHEATAFRSELKPVICIPDKFSTVEQWTKSETIKFLIDTQQQRIVQWISEETFDLETFKKSDFAIDGWINYPMAQRISVYNDVSKEQFIEVAKNLNILLLPLSKQEKQIKITEDFLQKQINIVKTGKMDDVKKAIAYITLPLTRLLILEKTEKSTHLARIKKLLSYFSQICTQILKNSDIVQNNDNYMSKRLFPIYILETLLFQNHKDYEGLYGDSIWNMFSEAAKRKEGAKNLEKKEDMTKILGILGTSALTPELRTKWETFISALEEKGLGWKEIEKKSKRLEEIETNFASASILKKAFYKKDKKEITEEFSKPENKNKIDFFKSLQILGNVNLLELWLHTCFADKSDIKNIDDLIKEVADTKDFLIPLIDYKEKAEAFSTEGFSDPKKFIKVWNDFKKNIFDYFVSDEFTNGFEKTNRLGKLAATSIMEMFVTKFDTAIKAVTGSNLYVVTSLPEQKSFDDVKNDKEFFKQQINNNRDKIFTFHLMLEDYLKLLQKWYTVQHGLGIFLPKYEEMSIEDVLNIWAPQKLEELKQQTGDANMLTAKNFSVASVVIGNSARWDRQGKNVDTHEKLFTFCHQSLEAIIEQYVVPYGINEKLFPEEILKIQKQIFSIKVYDTIAKRNLPIPKLIGQSLKGDLLTLNYNYPQRNHSAHITITYNISTKKSLLTFELFGFNEHYRWNICSDFAEIKSYMLKIPCTVTTTLETFGSGSSQGGFSVTWELEPNSLDKIIQPIAKIIEFSCEYSACMDANMLTKAEAELDNDQSISAFATFNRIYWGLNVAVNAALKSSTEDSQKNLLILLKKLIDFDGDYLVNSEKFFAIYFGYSFREDTTNKISQKILQNHLDILTQEDINFIWQNSENLTYMPYDQLSEEQIRILKTQESFSKKTWSNTGNTIIDFNKIEQLNNEELIAFVLRKDLRIFRMDYDEELFTKTLPFIKSENEKLFIDNFSKALKNKNTIIKKNALNLLTLFLQNPSKFNTNLVQKTLDTNIETIISIYTEKIKFSTNYQDLKKQEASIFYFINKLSIKNEYMQSIQKTVNKKLLELTHEDLKSQKIITHDFLNALEKIYQDNSFGEDTIKEINTTLIKSFIFDPKAHKSYFRENMQKKLNKSERLNYNDIKRFIKLIVNAIKRENYSVKINDLFKEVFDIDYPINTMSWILGYLIWLNTEDYKNMLPVEISAPKKDDWQVARCIHILNEFINQNKDKELPSITIKKDVFAEKAEQVLDKEKLQEFISTNPNTPNIRELAERSSEAIIITNKFEDLINLLQKPEKTNNTILLGSTVDLLRYLILLHTKLFDKIPAALIPIQVQEDKDTSDYIECLKNFKETHPTVKITFESPFDKGIKNIFNDKELEEFAIEHTNTNEDDLEEANQFMNDFALKAARLIRPNEQFDKLKNMLPKSKESKEKVYLSECSDLLRYLILLNTRKFEQIPTAQIAKSIEPNITNKKFLRFLIRSFLDDEELASLVTFLK